MIIWGSPCQWFSFAGKQLNFNDPRSKLFFEFVRLVKEINPKYFLLENVKMRRDYQDKISEMLWVQPIEINSALVSAQSRKRLYWTNIPGVKQPHDKWILLKDILQDNVDEKYYLTEKQYQMIDNWKWFEKPLERIKWPNDKMDTITTHVAKMSNGIKLVREIKRIWGMYGQTTRWWIYDKEWLAPTITASMWMWWWHVPMVQEIKYIRKLTPIECERLQTLPDNYTEWVSDTQRYIQLGNWWTVDVIAHIFSFLNKQDA